MSSGAVLRSIVVTKWKSFCAHSSLHGLYYLYKSTSWLVRSAWVLVIALSAALCCFLGHMIWEKYVIDPTLTVVETTHYSVLKIEFPAVAVCDSEQVHVPSTQNISELLLLRGFNLTQVTEFYRSFDGVTRQDYEPEGYVKKIHSLLEDLGYPQQLLLEMFKRPCSDMIVDCNWRSQPHNCSDMFRSVFTIRGHCCQFDIPYFRQNTDAQTNYISSVEASEALDITVTRPQESVDPDQASGYPMLFVFDRKDKITLVDSATVLTPRAFYDVNVYTWAIDSSDNVKALPLASRKCTLHTDKGSSATFYQDCMSRMILKRVANQCRCLPFNYTAKELNVDEYSGCSWDRLSCVYQAVAMVQMDIKDVLSDSDCYQRCDYVQYDNVVKFVKHQRHLTTLDERASRVQVHFGQMTCMKYRREILYTWDQMLANLGGIFGLCLGGSIISVIEIIWFIIELLISLIASYCREPADTRDMSDNATHNNKVFFVSQKNKPCKKLNHKITFNNKYKYVN